MLWLAFLPFSLWPACGWTSVPASGEVSAGFRIVLIPFDHLREFPPHGPGRSAPKHLLTHLGKACCLCIILQMSVIIHAGIISFLLLGIEEIGVQIEEPFGILPLYASSFSRIFMHTQQNDKEVHFSSAHAAT